MAQNSTLRREICPLHIKDVVGREGSSHGTRLRRVSGTHRCKGVTDGEWSGREPSLRSGCHQPPNAGLSSELPVLLPAADRSSLGKPGQQQAGHVSFFRLVFITCA